MNKTRVLSIVLLIAIVLATPTYAISDKASDQLFHYNVDVTTSNGKINVSANVVGSLSATKVGLENICVYEKSGSSWIWYAELFEDDPDMSVDSRAYLDTIQIDITPGHEYIVYVTIFAQADRGRDTRSFDFNA